MCSEPTAMLQWLAGAKNVMSQDVVTLLNRLEMKCRFCMAIAVPLLG